MIDHTLQSTTSHTKKIASQMKQDRRGEADRVHLIQYAAVPTDHGSPVQPFKGTAHSVTGQVVAYTDHLIQGMITLAGVPSLRPTRTGRGDGTYPAHWSSAAMRYSSNGLNACCRVTAMFYPWRSRVCGWSASMRFRTTKVWNEVPFNGRFPAPSSRKNSNLSGNDMVTILVFLVVHTSQTETVILDRKGVTHSIYALKQV